MYNINSTLVVHFLQPKKKKNKNEIEHIYFLRGGKRFLKKRDSITSGLYSNMSPL